MNKKWISLILAFAMCLSLCVPAFASDSKEDDETIAIGGTQYIVERVLTDRYSQAIIRNAATKAVVQNVIYYYDRNILVDELSRQVIVPASTSAKNGVHSNQVDDGLYEYKGTYTYNFTIAELGIVGTAAAIVALHPGVATAVVTAVVAEAIKNGLSSIYASQEFYSYRAKEGGVYYLYVKRITSIYSNDGSLLAGPWTSYQRIREK